MIAAKGIGEAILAYRRFDPPKCNIHFAHDAFAAIESLGDCVAIAVDIKHFFDCIDHNILKRAWCRLLDTPKLPNDHYAVFKAVTRYASVDREEAFDVFGISQRQRISWRGPMCTPSEYRQQIRGQGLISVHSTGKGIPQGSPASALLSNVYMLEMDESMQKLANSHGCVYRRYSDDILLIGPASVVTKLETQLKMEVKKLKLDINDDKTARSQFNSETAGKLRADKPLQYLGFTFDGKRVLVRSQTLAKYIRRMKTSVRSARRAAIRASKRGGVRRLRREELFTRFSHLGPRPSKLRSAKDQQLKNNFWSYSKRATRIMEDESIRKQLRKHWPGLNAEIEIADHE